MIDNSYFINGQEFLFCPFCGKQGFIRLGKHLSMIHKISSQKANCKVVISAYSEARRQQLSEQRKNSPEFREKLKAAVSKQMKQRHQDKKFQKFLIEKANQARSDKWKKDSVFALNMSKKLLEGKKKWLEDENNRQSVRDKARAEMIESWKTNPLFTNNNRNGVTCIYKDSLNRIFYLHSYLEEKLAQILDSLVPGQWGYEAVRIPYYFKETEHVYVPDFLIKEKILLEVKSSNKLKDPQVLAKKESAISAGYHYHFITEKDLSIESIRCKLT